MPREHPQAPRGADALDDPSAPLYTIGQVSDLLGMPAATLRRLEDERFVVPQRSDGGQRRYSRDEVDRLHEIRQLTDEGVTLPGVRKVLELRRRVDELEDQLARRDTHSATSGERVARDPAVQ
ncbi:MAG: MerR family transcriptional regulator [Microbacteriaceae bacterium]|nr:MAG: MerR family transcriptional regulator [Microbacteriaceae bacterium]